MTFVKNSKHRLHQVCDLSTIDGNKDGIHVRPEPALNYIGVTGLTTQRLR